MEEKKGRKRNGGRKAEKKQREKNSEHTWNNRGDKALLLKNN